jgi:hypothetical protein
MGGAEKLNSRGLPGHRHTPSGQPLPGLPAHHRQQGRSGERRLDRAPPPGASRRPRRGVRAIGLSRLAGSATAAMRALIREFLVFTLAGEWRSSWRTGPRPAGDGRPAWRCSRCARPVRPGPSGLSCSARRSQPRARPSHPGTRARPATLGTIRGDYALDLTYNLVPGSAYLSPASGNQGLLPGARLPLFRCRPMTGTVPPGPHPVSVFNVISRSFVRRLVSHGEHAGVPRP